MASSLYRRLSEDEDDLRNLNREAEGAMSLCSWARGQSVPMEILAGFFGDLGGNMKEWSINLVSVGDLGASGSL